MSKQVLMAGSAKVDITPKENVWLDGMIRVHQSTGVHDHIFARALVLSVDDDMKNAVVIVSCDICTIPANPVSNTIRKTASQKTGIPFDNMLIAGTHTHSAPATAGVLNPRADSYTDNEFTPKVIEAICKAAQSMRPAAIGYGRGKETTISHYRRLLTTEGKIVMNWVPYPPEKIVGPAEEADYELGVVKVVSADDPKSIIAIIYNHAGHPNVMSGDNLLVSGDYPGLASTLLEKKFDTVALFLNGAQGSVDIDGLKDRDWEGVTRTGTALADAVADVAGKIKPQKIDTIKAAAIKYGVPYRIITPEELSWAKKIVASSTGEKVAMADGVGDDYVSSLYLKLNEKKGQSINLEMMGIAFNDFALVSFPGEPYNEIGVKIKKQSPFKYTYLSALSNDSTGYYPTKKGIGQGGYCVDTRNCDASSEEIILKKTAELLGKLAK